MSERRLTGIRVLVTRPRARAEELCFLLEEEGAEVLAVPLLEVVPPSDDRGLRAAAERLGRFAWVAFASAPAVEALVEAARTSGTLGALRRLRVAVVGPGTARAARAAGLEVTLEGAGGTGAALGEELLGRLAPGEEVLLPAAEEGRPELEMALAGTAPVTRVAAYRTERQAVGDGVWSDVLQRPPGVVLFASPRTAEAFVEGGGRPVLGSARVVAIGPTTAAALGALGVPVAGVADRPTSADLVEAAVRAVRG
ncbi:MAG TPA: uroporphyrinogen-III synthase [Myxococcaceae bacterium]|nr:uroporphyrinogen-III synthase [Myxococcaceae bacterium]